MTAVAVVIFVAAYVAIATEWFHRVTVALTGAGLMLAFGILDAQEAFHDTETGVDWDVIFLLLGMMVIVGVLRQTGVFDYVSIWAAKRAGGKPFRVMVLLVVITAAASAMLDNVTTVLLVAPVTILICERLDAPPVPFLLAEAMASNIGGRLPRQPRAARRPAAPRVPRPVPGDVPRRVHLPAGARGGGARPRREGGDH
jgi:Na+/H+ antiporter NhaD/arsenite permease-like protein